MQEIFTIFNILNVYLMLKKNDVILEISIETKTW